MESSNEETNKSISSLPSTPNVNTVVKINEIKKPTVNDGKITVDIYVKKMMKKYNRLKTGSLNVDEAHVMLQHFTSVDLEREDIKRFLQSVDSNGDALIQEDELAEFIKGGIALTAAERQSYKARGGLQNMIIQFFDGVKREMNTLHRPIANFIGQVWYHFDKDEDGELNITETKALLEHFTGHELSIEDVEKFLRSIDEDDDAKIQREELVHFINHGLQLSKDAKEEYGKISPFHKTIIEFFDGVEKERRTSIAGYFSVVWNEFDINSDDALDALELKVMLEHFTDESVDINEIINFLKDSSYADQNGTLRRDKVMKMILDGHEFTEIDRMEYVNKGPAYMAFLAFFDSFHYSALNSQNKVMEQQVVEENQKLGYGLPVEYEKQEYVKDLQMQVKKVDKDKVQIEKPPQTPQEQAATKIQARHRGIKARERHIIKHNAATKIQRIHRGKRARVRVRHLHTKRKKELNNAQEIRLAQDANSSNGIDLSVYARIWIRETEGVNALTANQRTLKVPHTIVFLHGAPTQWYFTSKVDGKYLRRKKKKVTINEIIEYFTRKYQRKVSKTTSKKKGKRKNTLPGSNTIESVSSIANEIVAFWMTNNLEDARKEIRYLTYEELRRFVLTGGAKKQSGILQEYIKSAGVKRRTVRVDWTPHICQIEQCESRFKQDLKSHTHEEKLADFDSKEGNTFKKKIAVTTKKGSMLRDLSKAITNRIETIANMANGLVMDRFPNSPTGKPSTPLTQYLSTCSFSDQRRFMSFRVHRCILHFIIGEDGNTYFTYSTFLDIGETNSTTKRINPNGLYSTSTMVDKLSASNRFSPKKKRKPSPLKEKFSETCDSLGLGGTNDFGEKFYKEYSDSQYASIAAKSEVNFVFSSESLLQNDGKLLRRFIRNYSYNTFGSLDLIGVFRLFNSTTGVLGINEFKNMFEEVNITMTARQLRKAVNLFDKDGDGSIDSSEFLDWVMQKEPKEDDVSKPEIDFTEKKIKIPKNKSSKISKTPRHKGTIPRRKLNILLPTEPPSGMQTTPKFAKGTQKAMKKYTENLEFLKVPRRPTQEKSKKMVARRKGVQVTKENGTRKGSNTSTHGMSKSEKLKYAYTQKLERPSSTKRRNSNYNTKRKGRKLVNK